ncbi:DUF3106 domain-containing protein [Aurantivibrio infirmus]
MAYGFVQNISLRVLIVTLLFIVAFPVLAQEAEPIAWDALNKYEQLALKPLQENWSELDPQQQKQFQLAAERMLTRSIKREAFNRERFRRWSTFSHDRREHMRDRYRHYREIDPDRREKMRAARERFENLSEEEKREIQQRWESLPPDQRPRFGPRGHRPPPPMDGRDMERRKSFDELNEEEKQEWRERREERRERRDSFQQEESQENVESDSGRK